MTQQPNVRIKVPEQARAGEVIEVRAMIMHPMETGFRFDTQGTKIPVHIIERFVCRYLGESVFDAEFNTGIAANPYVSFCLKASVSGELQFEWHDDDGSVYTHSAPLTVT
jgi:sulfur-oxidizing protein SoxZ